MTQTGLSSVFEDAVIPTLLYLPNLTPQDESLLLLPAAYTALFALADAQFRSADAKETGETHRSSEEELVFYDRLMRQGVLQGYAYTAESPPIVTLLVAALSALVERMGIHAVKHLKDVIPILCTAIADPFATSCMPLLEASVGALQRVILNCWPRVGRGVWKGMILRALVGCWMSVREEGEGVPAARIVAVTKELGVCGRMLVSAVEGEEEEEGSIREDIGFLIERDETIGMLFGMSEDGLGDVLSVEES